MSVILGNIFLNAQKEKYNTIFETLPLQLIFFKVSLFKEMVLYTWLLQ